jgi:spermidine synthase
MVYEVDQDDPWRHHRLLHHAGTAHGLQFMHPDRRAIPTAYYDASSGVGRIITAMQEARGDAALRIGAVGLGIGTIAAYTRPGDGLVFYEIDPDVIDIAQRRFHFLTAAPGRVLHVLGDGRLSLQRQTPQGFDLVVLDAFSGDSIPIHLLTVQALEVYRRHLAPGGIITIHISNQYLDLEPLVASLADELGMSIVSIHRQADESLGAYASLWVALWDRGLPPLVDPSPFGQAPGPRRVRPWTDDYSNLLGVVKRRETSGMGAQPVSPGGGKP